MRPAGKCVVGFFVAAGCSVSEEELPPRIVDQSGAEFFWACAPNGRCEVHRIAGVSPPLPECGNTRPAYGYSWARFISIDAFCGSVFVNDGGRFAVCEADDDCPQLPQYGDEFECRHGFCQNVDTAEHPPGPPDRRNLRRLCEGDAPRYANDGLPPELEEALDVACAHSDEEPQAGCTSIPASCPDPG